MAIGPVITRGFGTFGSVNLVVTRGYGIGTPPVPNSPWCLDAAQVYVAGAQQAQAYSAGAQASEVYVPGSQQSQIGC